MYTNFGCSKYFQLQVRLRIGYIITTPSQQNSENDINFLNLLNFLKELLGTIAIHKRISDQQLSGYTNCYINSSYAKAAII